MRGSRARIMIDIHVEHTFPLSRMRDHVPSRPSPATAFRWAMEGIRGIRLETLMIGGRRYTSREAVVRFLARRNEPPSPEPVAPSKARAEEKARVSHRAEAIFDRPAPAPSDRNR